MAILPGGTVLPMAYTAAAAIVVGSPVYRSGAGEITTSSLTDATVTRAKDTFGIFVGTASGGDAVTGDTDCQVAIGAVECNAGDAITEGDEVVAFYSATSGLTTVSAVLTTLVLADTIVGTAIGTGAAAGKVAINVSCRKVETAVTP